jgi:2-dehydro-3-deoxyphosphogluconate aldolase/(4S)-4-hydroxy-2-oxoglutarate aldolase
MAIDRADTLARMMSHRLAAIIRTRDQDLAAEAMRAAIRGGFRVVEFTMNTPGALALIESFSVDTELVVGAGTVLTVEQARTAVAAGARFIVSPVVDPAVIAAGRKLDAVTVPGTYTPTEMRQAVEVGADMVKLFPAPANIAQYVRQIVGPLPDLKIFPTAGVGSENFVEILRAGACGVGFVSSLFVPDEMARRDLAAIERRADAIHTAWRAFDAGA